MLDAGDPKSFPFNMVILNLDREAIQMESIGKKELHSHPIPNPTNF